MNALTYPEPSREALRLLLSPADFARSEQRFAEWAERMEATQDEYREQHANDVPLPAIKRPADYWRPTRCGGCGGEFPNSIALASHQCYCNFWARKSAALEAAKGRL